MRNAKSVNYLLLLASACLEICSYTSSRYSALYFNNLKQKTERQLSLKSINRKHAQQNGDKLSLQGTSLFSSTNDADETPIDISSNDKLYSVSIPRNTGIEWGTDLSFTFVYVRSLEPTGSAFQSGMVNEGDQICQLRAVLPTDELDIPQNLVGAPFDVVMNSFASLDMSIKEVELIFFRGTKEELKAAASGNAVVDDENIVITVIEKKGTPNEKVQYIKAAKGCNIRQILTDRGINVYQSLTRWTNCKGKQLCGTCIVNVSEGGESTNRKSVDEESTLRENPPGYRLSCVAFAYGDVTVEIFPPIKAAQWTR